MLLLLQTQQHRKRGDVVVDYVLNMVVGVGVGIFGRHPAEGGGM